MNLHTFLEAAILVLAVGCVAVGFFRRLGFGSILGLLAAGVALGPSGFHITEDVEGLRQFAELGVVFLLFLIGLELHPAKLWQMRRDVFGLGLAQVLVTGGVLAVFMHLYGSQSWTHAGLAGLALALSSTAFVLQVLGDRRELWTEHGRSSFAVLLLQDLAVVPLLALMEVAARSSDPTGGTSWGQRLLLTLGALAVIGLVGKVLAPLALRSALRTRNYAGFAAVCVLAVLLAAWLAEHVGLSMALGGFLVGLLLSDSEFRPQIESVAEQFKELLLSLFFIAVGMSMDLGALQRGGQQVAVLVLGVLLIKPAVLFLLCLLFRKRLGTALRTALLCGQCGEFAFVLTAQAVALGLTDAATSSVVVLAVSLTMALTPLLVKLADVWGARLDQAARPASTPAEAPPDIAQPKVIVGGYGECGRPVCEALSRQGIPFVAFDLDWDRVAAGKQQGQPVFGGDITRLNVLRSAGAEQSPLLVITLSEAASAERAIRAFRLLAPRTPVVARAPDATQGQRLEAAGATRTVAALTELNARLVETALSSLALPQSAAKHASGVPREPPPAPPTTT